MSSCRGMPCFTMISGNPLRSPCLPLARHLTTPSCDIGRLDPTFNPPSLGNPIIHNLLRSSFILFAKRERSCKSANSICNMGEQNSMWASGTVTSESLVSREFSRIILKFHFSISISRHFHFTFHSRSRFQGLFISLFILDLDFKAFSFHFSFSK